MIVPKYWAEGSSRHRKDGRQITMRRFGWSNLNPDQAQAMADQRATEALQRTLAGIDLPRREPKVPYNGADGVPIREEIVEEHGDTVVTRNSYGALCLNTPDVLFADVDFQPSITPEKTKSLVGIFVMVAAPVIALCATINTRLGLPVFVLLCALGGLGTLLLAASLFRQRSRAENALQAAETDARLKVSSFGAANPNWKFRLYRTPAGLRIMAMHRLFSPDEPEATRLFDALGCDPLYVRMCRRQQCFRARVSPKPWRIGIVHHLLPKPGVWPIRSDAMPRRKAWVESYDKKAAAFASCRFESEIGRGVAHEKALVVQRLHDRLCAADSGKPIA